MAGSEGSSIDARFKELSINHYSVPETQLQNLKSFVSEFGRDERFGKYEREIDYMVADGLSNARDHMGALDLFRRLYEDHSFALRPVLTQRIAEQLVLLGREDEAMKTIDGALKSETNLSYRLDLFFWAVSNLNHADDKLEKYSSQAKDISLFLGIEIPSGLDDTFSEEIKFLKAESIKANRRFNRLMMRIHKMSTEDQVTELKTYIKQEVIIKYRMLAEESLGKIQ
jgi:hypothetical protein